MTEIPPFGWKENEPPDVTPTNLEKDRNEIGKYAQEQVALAETKAEEKLDAFEAQKGVANGLASLNAETRLPEAQLPSSAVNSSTRYFYIYSPPSNESLDEEQAVDYGPVIQNALDEGYRRIWVFGGGRVWIKTPVFFDAFVHSEGLTYHIDTDGRTPIHLGQHLPTSSSFAGAAGTRWAFFVNTKRTALKEGVVEVTNGNRASGSTGVNSALVIHDGVAFVAAEENTGVASLNHCGIGVGRISVSDMSWGFAAFGYAEDTTFTDPNLTGMKAGGYFWWTPEEGDTTRMEGINALHGGIWRAIGARGGQVEASVNGQFYFSQCRAITINGCHAEDFSGEPYITVDRSQLTINCSTISPENVGETPRIGVVVEDNPETEQQGTILTLDCTTFYVNLERNPESLAIADLELKTLNPSSRIIARAATKGTTFGGLAEYNPASINVTSPIEAVQQALTAGRTIIAGGNWELAKSRNNEWVVTALSPMSGITTPKALSPPTVTAGPGTVTAIKGTLEGGVTYEYVAACLDIDNYYSALGAPFTRVANAESRTTHALYTVPTTPCVVRIWRKKLAGGVKTEPTAYVDLPVGSNQIIAYDTGEYCNQIPWIKVGVPVPETVAAGNETFERIRLASGVSLIWGDTPPENNVAAPVGSVFLHTTTGAAYRKTEGTNKKGWVEFGARGEAGPSSNLWSFLKLVTPAFAPSGVPTSEVVTGTAFKAVFMRVVIPSTGHLKDLSIFNGATSEGKHNVALFDTGQAAAGKYTLLWESGEVEHGAANGWQVVGNPEHEVSTGEQYLLAFMNSTTTHKCGTGPGTGTANAYQLPVNFIPTTGEAEPKILGNHAYGELKYATITEAQLAKGSVASFYPIILGRVA